MISRSVISFHRGLFWLLTFRFRCCRARRQGTRILPRRCRARCQRTRPLPRRTLKVCHRMPSARHHRCQSPRPGPHRRWNRWRPTVVHPRCEVAMGTTRRRCGRQEGRLVRNRVVGKDASAAHPTKPPTWGKSDACCYSHRDGSDHEALNVVSVAVPGVSFLPRTTNM